MRETRLSATPCEIDRAQAQSCSEHLRAVRRSSTRSVPPRDDHVGDVSSRRSGSRLADTVAAHLNLKLEDKQRAPRASRVRWSATIRATATSLMQLRDRGASRSRSKHPQRGCKQADGEASQKEYYLNEQMRAIQKELGEKRRVQERDGRSSRMKLAKSKLTSRDEGPRQGREGDPQAQDDVADERRGDRRAQLRRLDPERCRGTSTKDDEARPRRGASASSTRITTASSKVKERILEYLAVQSLVEKIKGPILCFVGPPGRRQDVARQVDRPRDRP